MDLSVIITCKDRDENLAYCLASISTCNPVPAQVILVDFGSKNPLTEYSDKYPNLVHTIRVTRDVAIFHKARALNIGLRAAQTKYVCLTDADQVYQTDLFKIVYDKACSLNDLVMCKTKLLHDKPGWFTLDTVRTRYNDLVRYASETYPRMVGEGCCQCLETKFMVDLGGYDERYVGWGYEDTDFICRARRRGKTPWYIHEMSSMVHLPHSRAANYYSNYFAGANKQRLVQTRRSSTYIANVSIPWGEL